MNKLIALNVMVASASAKITPEIRENLATLQRDGVAADSSFGRHLLAKSKQIAPRKLEEELADMSFVSKYSIKFIGCHHVTQWNDDEEMWQEAQEEQEDGDQDGEESKLSASNGRIISKGLIRFRLCPTDSCFDHFGNGCSSNYGEYVVDMSTFLQSYVAFQIEQAQVKCATYRNVCYKECYESSNANCYSNCYGKYGVNAALCSDGNGNANNYYEDGNNYQNRNNEFDLETYLECAEYEVYNSAGEEISNFLGPYCANQGGDIRLGFFQDKYCMIPSGYQPSYFEKITGIEIPYTKTSLVSTNCLSCESTDQENQANNQQDYYNYDANGNKNYYVATYVNELCGNMYMSSGKCESNFNSVDVPYPEEGACTYIEGVKRLKSDGIIRSDQNISSKPASIAIGVFTGLAACLGGYVYYLKSKISRSRVNLAGATTSLA